MNGSRSAYSRWSIVLAGGEGTRLRPFIKGLLGHPRPKQYCAFLGDLPMIEQTLERARVLSHDRIVTVIGKGHQTYLETPRAISVPGKLIEQPVNCDTGPGLFLPLAYVLKQDPSATVCVFPSDHYISPDNLLLLNIDRAAELAEMRPENIVLLAAVPDRAEKEYGWIRPAPMAIPECAHARAVAMFIEKPMEGADALMNSGCLWNTMIMAFKAQMIWDAGKELYPEIIARFEDLMPYLGTDEEDFALSETYADMPVCNFSKDIIERIAHRALVLPMEGVEWSDWGQAESIHQTLARQGLAMIRADQPIHQPSQLVTAI